MPCCEALNRRIADPDEEDRRSGKIFFLEDYNLELYVEGSGEIVECKFCPFCGTDVELEHAKSIQDHYLPVLDNLRIRATGGSKEAAREIITVLTDYYQALKDLRFRTTDENESIKAGTLVRITQEYIDEQEAKKTKIDKLRDIATKEPTDENVRNFVRALSEDV